MHDSNHIYILILPTLQTHAHYTPVHCVRENAFQDITRRAHIHTYIPLHTCIHRHQHILNTHDEPMHIYTHIDAHTRAPIVSMEHI